MDFTANQVSADPDRLVSTALATQISLAPCPSPDGDHAQQSVLIPFPVSEQGNQPAMVKPPLHLVPRNAPQGTDPAPERLRPKWVG